MDTMSLSEQESTEDLPPETHEVIHSHDEAGAKGGHSDAHQEEHSDEGRHSAKQSVHKNQYDAFLTEMEKFPDTETKLQFAIDFMEKSLAEGGTPHFKSFWDARTLCLELFKENIQPALRSILWAKYHELSKEARRLKDILDEQSAFAVEQIEIAVAALEQEIEAFTEFLEKLPSFEFPQAPAALVHRITEYTTRQRELNFLNALAARINAMRKELIRTEMRVRHKNKFFQRLSSMGDKVFPIRKERIKEISQMFLDDVDAFIAVHFKQASFHGPLFALREEIKSLQNVAKILTLNTHAFTHTRMRLSECWEKIKTEDKERKKERSHLREVHKQNLEIGEQKLQEFRQKNETEQLTPSDALKLLEAVVAEIRSLDLGRDEIHALKEAVQGIRKPIQEKIRAQEQERQQQDQEKELQRRHKIQELRKQLEQLAKSGTSMGWKEIEDQRNVLIETLGTLIVHKAEKLEIDRQLKALRDLISEKKESSLLALSEGDKQSLQQCKEVLKQRKLRRQEIKAQIDALRKAAGSSGLDFEQAMNFNAQVEEERERLEKINQAIEEIEQQIAQLSKQSSL